MMLIQDLDFLLQRISDLWNWMDPQALRIERERQITAIGGCPSLSTAQSHQELELRLRNLLIARLWLQI